jgi:hypothetical protein
MTHTPDECELLAIDRMLTLDDELDEREAGSLYFLPEMIAVDLWYVHTLF